MNFTRGLDPKIAMNTGLRALEIKFIGYGPDQPHNRSMAQRILNYPNDEHYGTILFFDDSDIKTSKREHTCMGWASKMTLQEFKETEYNYILFKDIYYKIK